MMPGPIDGRDRAYLGALLALCLLFFTPVIVGAGNFWEDLIFLEFPARVFSRDSFLSLRFPHWNPYAFNGTPFFASVSSGVLYPFNLFLSFLPVSNDALWYLIQVNIVGHFFLAGTCMYAYMRYREASRPGAAFAALGYMLSGFLVTHIIHPMMLYVLAWMPLTILFLEKGIRGGKTNHLLIAGTILGISSLAGHPQISLYEFLFLAAYAFFLWFGRPDRTHRSWPLPLLPFLVALGLALVMILPAWELSNNSSRVSWTFQQAAENSLQFGHLLTFLVPKLFGAWTGPGNEAPVYWLEGPGYGYFTYWDTCFYVGVSILLFALVQMVRNRDDRFVRFAILWWILTFLFALGSNSYLYKLFFDFVPGFDRFRSPARITFTWAFLLPVLAARTFDELRRKDRAEELLQPFVLFASLFAAVAIAAMLGTLGNVWPQILARRELADHVSAQGALLLLNVALVFIPVALIVSGRIGARRGQGLLILALAVDLFLFGYGTHVTDEISPASYYATNAEDIEFLQREAEEELFRVNSRQFDITTIDKLQRQTGMIFGLNQGMINGIQLVEGYHPLKLVRRLPPATGINQLPALLDLLNVKYYAKAGALGPGGEVEVLLNGDRLPRARMFYRARILADDAAVAETMTGGVFDYRNELLLTRNPPLSLPSRSPNEIANAVSIREYTPNRIHLAVETEEDGLLWLSEIWYPAWKAYVDGEEVEILTADFSFRAIPVPRGSHEVHFVFHSGYFRAGAFSAVATLLLVAAGLLGIPSRLRSFLPLLSGGPPPSQEVK